MCRGLAHFVIGEFPRPGGRSVLVGDTDLTKIGTTPGPGSWVFDFVQKYWEDSWKGKRLLSAERLPLNPATQRELMQSSFIKPDQKSAFLEQTSNTVQGQSGVPIHPYIKYISYLEDYPRSDVAKEMMRYIANEIAPVMKAHNWTVDHLTEYYPDKPRDYGCNLAGGHVIFLRLREGKDREKFLTWDEIMSTVLHELIHITITEHNHDFHAQESLLEADHGVNALDAPYRPKLPYEPIPAGHVMIAIGGRKLYLLRAEYEEHFSNCWRHYPQSPGCILPRYFTPAVIARSAYIAKGIDPDTWTTSNSEIKYDDYRFASSDASQALKLCLRMYQEGEIVGWHPSSRDWLAQKLAWIITWYPRTQNRPFTSPAFSHTSYDMTHYFAEPVRYIYRETIPSDKCLRDRVAEVLRDVARICQERPGYFNTDILDALIEDTPGLRSDCKWIDSGDCVRG